MTRPVQNLPNEASISNLDILRAIAVLLVYFAHFLMMFHVGDPWGISIYSLSQAGVMIFFVHTAFVLMLSLSAKKEMGGVCFALFTFAGSSGFTR